jgi:hypothetical protein
LVRRIGGLEKRVHDLEILEASAMLHVLSTQMAINPFAGAPEGWRDIMDPTLEETLREFSTMDGACVIREDGVVLAAGLPQGLGARHRSAAGITALTNSIAIVISESTGDVRIFSRGRLFAVHGDRKGHLAKCLRRHTEDAVLPHETRTP